MGCERDGAEALDVGLLPSSLHQLPLLASRPGWKTRKKCPQLFSFFFLLPLKHLKVHLWWALSLIKAWGNGSWIFSLQFFCVDFFFLIPKSWKCQCFNQARHRQGHVLPPLKSMSCQGPASHACYMPLGAPGTHCKPKGSGRCYWDNVALVRAVLCLLH